MNENTSKYGCEYRIITFSIADLSWKIQTNLHIQDYFTVHRAEFHYVGDVPDGYYAGDDTQYSMFNMNQAECHAAMVIERARHSKKYENTTAGHLLALDYRNFLSSFSQTYICDAARLENMLRVALSFGQYNEIISYTQEVFSNLYFDDKNRRDYQLNYKDYFFRVLGIFVEAGDFCLFSDYDIYHAMQFYHFVIYWHNTVQVRELNRYDDRCRQIINAGVIFESIYYGYRIDYESQQRLVMVLACNGCTNLLPYVIYAFQNENENFQSAFFEKHSLNGQFLRILSDKIKSFRGTRFDKIATDMKITDKKSLMVCLDYIEVAVITCFMQEELRVRPGNSTHKICYYTSISTFSYMFPDHCRGDKANMRNRLTIMNVAYMNDPNEGKLLNRAVFGARKAGTKEKEDISIPYVFVKCFTDDPDRLPMWKMYGDDTKGICVEMDLDKTLQYMQNGFYPIYNVCYLHKGEDRKYKVSNDNNHRLLKKSCDMIEQWIDRIREISRRNGRSAGFIGSLIEQYGYLFKDDAYAYENEQRIIYQFFVYDKKSFMYTENTNPAMLFVLSGLNHILQK